MEIDIRGAPKDGIAVETTYRGAPEDEVAVQTTYRVEVEVGSVMASRN